MVGYPIASKAFGVRPSGPGVSVGKPPERREFVLQNPFWADLLAHKGRMIKISTEAGHFIGVLLAADLQHFNIELRVDGNPLYIRGEALLSVELLP